MPPPPRSLTYRIAFDLSPLNPIAEAAANSVDYGRCCHVARTFMHCDLGYFDDETCRLGPIEIRVAQTVTYVSGMHPRRLASPAGFEPEGNPVHSGVSCGLTTRHAAEILPMFAYPQYHFLRGITTTWLIGSNMTTARAKSTSQVKFCRDGGKDYQDDQLRSWDER